MVFYNRTRVSSSIPQRLRDEDRWYLLPLYWLLSTSDLAREAIAGSGSWRFADHIYRNKAGGRFGIGVVIDLILLRLAPARAFRTRYEFARQQATKLLSARSEDRPLSILSVPCGIPRDLIEAAAGAGPMHGVTLYGLDLDPEPIETARTEMSRAGIEPSFEFVVADAFDTSAYPKNLDMVISTGFGEFLDDDQLQRFLSICRSALAPTGTLVITATAAHRLGDFLLREAELFAHYRSSGDLSDHLHRAGFESVTISTDRTGLQAHATATKESP